MAPAKKERLCLGRGPSRRRMYQNAPAPTTTKMAATMPMIAPAPKPGDALVFPSGLFEVVLPPPPGDVVGGAEEVVCIVGACVVVTRGLGEGLGA